MKVSNAEYNDGVPTSILREITFLKLFSQRNLLNIYEVEIKGEVCNYVQDMCNYNIKDYIRKQNNKPQKGRIEFQQKN